MENLILEKFNKITYTLEEYNKVKNGFFLSYIYNLKLDNLSYCKMYILLHEKYTGKECVYYFKNLIKLEDYIKCKLHVGGVHVNELILFKFQPGSSKDYKDCSIYIKLSFENTIRSLFNINNVNYDYTTMDKLSELKCIQIIKEIAYCLLIYIKKELDIVILKTYFNFSKINYILL